MVGTAERLSRGLRPALVAGHDWQKISTALDQDGFAPLGRALTATDCARLVALYEEEAAFRSRVVMARHGFGAGEYKYLGYPLPAKIEALRQTLYPRLVPVANAWAERLGRTERYPERLEDFLKLCHAAGQRRPTPLLLKYLAGDYNCLHQDLYGELAFPLQLAVLLSEPGRDFEGGEFLLVEQRPRRQSKAEVVPLRQGEGVIFAVNHRPRQGARGYHRAVLRHGVSRVRSGSRYTLGIIFHDAR